MSKYIGKNLDDGHKVKVGQILKLLKLCQYLGYSIDRKLKLFGIWWHFQ